jgi:hypothetical protein
MRKLLPSRGTRTFVVGLLAAVSAACATTHYTQSAVVAVPSDAKGKAASAASLQVDGVKLRIEPLDRAPRDHAPPPLRLRIVFDPPELGYSFDAGQVVLRSADGREWHASGGGYQPLSPKASVDVVFDAVVGPEATFDLVLDGLARGQRRLPPVTLRLARRKGTSYDRLYWLEAIEVLLYAGGGV